MYLKKKLTKDAYDALDDLVKKFYKEKGNDYILELEKDDDEETAELRRARDREAQEAKDLRKKLRDAEKKLEEIEGNDARKRGDVEAIEKSWKEKYDRLQKELSEGIEKQKEFIKKVMVKDNAEALANKISTVPKVLSKVIEERLNVDFDGENPTLRVLDKDGRPSALSLADLEKELVADDDLKGIIVASRASGGGAGTDTRPGKSSAIPPNDKHEDIVKLTPEQRAQRLTEKYKREGLIQ